MNVAIVKYNAGNIGSVENAVRRMGIEPMVTDDVEKIQSADRVIFPGQGEAHSTMTYLKAHRLDEVIVGLKQPVLGICIGMQLLCRHSEEQDTDCLGVFDVDVKRFIPLQHEDKVPQMGWNTVDAAAGSTLLAGVEHERFYFVHSYCVSDPMPEGRVRGLFAPDDAFKVTWCDYGSSRFAAAVERGPLSITQFHPEKSAQAGATLLRNWVDSFATAR